MSCLRQTALIAHVSYSQSTCQCDVYVAEISTMSGTKLSPTQLLPFHFPVSLAPYFNSFNHCHLHLHLFLYRHSEGVRDLPSRRQHHSLLSVYLSVCLSVRPFAFAIVSQKKYTHSGNNGTTTSIPTKFLINDKDYSACIAHQRRSLLSTNS